jgi:hypothetical protein
MQLITIKDILNNNQYTTQLLKSTNRIRSQHSNNSEKEPSLSAQAVKLEL